MARLLALLLVAACAGGCASSKSLMTVKVPVTDLRGQPNTAATLAAHDPLQETQLLYGEQVKVVKKSEGWVQVEALEQQEFSHAKRWQGYPGWVPAATLVPWDAFLSPTIVVTAKWAQGLNEPYASTPSSWRFPLGTRLRATDMGGAFWMVELVDGGDAVYLRAGDARSLRSLEEATADERRQLIVRSAERLLGDGYFWGGRSPQAPEWGGRSPQAADASLRVSGVDCSGLTNLAYRAAGVDIPRDAHEQFLRATPVEMLRPGDLLFLSERGDPKRIVHVMLYAGGDALIEGPGTGLAVRRIAVSERLGRPVGQLARGTVVDGQTVTFGSFVQ